MVVSYAHKKDIPKDAVIIDEEQALLYRWRIITEWENRWDVWSLRYGPGILGALSGATGFYINSHYRHKLKLGTYGRGSTYLPIVVIPALFTMLAHKFLVQRHILLDKNNECPLCLQTRAGLIQGGVGVCYPTILAPFAAFMFATRHFTYRIPSVTAEPLEVLKLWRNMTRPILPALGVAFAGQAFIAMYITYREQFQNWRLQMELLEIERVAEQRYEEDKLLEKGKSF